MATTQLVREMLAAGFTWDEVKGDASQSYRDMLGAGFTQEEVDKDVFDRYGFRFSYDPSLEDDLTLVEDLMTAPKPEVAEQQLVDAEVNQISEQEQFAKARENAEFDMDVRFPFRESYTPEQQAQIEEERKSLPSFRRYSDTELANQELYSQRDSLFTRLSERGELTDFDKQYQDSLVEQGLLNAPEPARVQPIIRGATPAEQTSMQSLPYKRKVSSAGESLLYGFRQSTTGLFFAGPPDDKYLPDNMSFGQKAAVGIAQGVGDLPTTVVGGIMGAAATAETGPGAIAGAFAGAMGLNEGVRASLLLGYQRGPIDSLEELAYRTGQIGLATGKGALTGYTIGYAGGLAQASAPFIAQGATGVVGQTLRASAQPLTEVAAMTAVNAGSEGRVPTMEDFALNGIMVGGYRLGGFYTNKLAYSFQKTGMNPESIIQYGKESPGVKEDIMSGNMILPKEFGGNYQPLYLIKRNQPLSKQGTGNEWYHISQNVAAKIAQSVNKKNKIQVDSAPEGYTVQNAAIPADTNLLWIKSKSDPNKARVYKQYMLEQDPKATFPDQQIVNRNASQLFENPPQSFIDFIQSGRARIGPQEQIPLSDIQGLRMGDKVMVFNQNNILSGDVLATVNKPMEIAAVDIQKSVSVNETTKPSKAQLTFDTYQALVDRFQPLNRQADPGQVTVPYLAARLYMGVDGLVNHWLTLGRTVYTRPSLLRNTGYERTPTGKSLKDIFAMGTSRSRFQLDPEVSRATEQISGRIKNASVESNTELLNALEVMRQSNEITPSAYNKARTQIMESTDALTNRNNPLNLFRSYVIAKHVNELAASGINTGVDVAAARTLIDNPAMKARFEPAAQELYAYQRALLDYRHRAGLISKKTLTKMTTQYPDYIPLNRVMDEGSASASTGTFAIKGSARDIIDPFESIIRQTQYTIREAERNTVMQLIAKEFGDSSSRSNSRTAQVGTLAQFRAIEAEARGASAQRTISYKVAGKEKKVAVPDDIYRTSQYLDPVSANANNGLVKAAAKAAGVLRAGAILHPNFGARNFFRDQFSAYINSDSGYQAFYDFGRGLATITKPSAASPRARAVHERIFPKAEEYYSEWLRSGGSNANLVSQDRTYTQDMIRTLLRTNNVQNSVPFTTKAIDGVMHYINPLNWGRKGYRALQELSEYSENATRVGEYIRARESGANMMESAYRSREVTMDFARMGASMKALNSMSVFLNAKIQGADRSIRQLRAHPGRTMNRIISGIVLPSMLLAMVQQDIIHNDPSSQTAQALQEIPNWQKNTYWIVPSEVGIFRIPIPHEYGVPFANPVRSFMEYMYEKSPDKNFLEKIYDEDYFGTVAEQYFLDWKVIVSSMLPTAIQPLSEVVSNYSLFTGTPIIPPTMESQAPESRYNRNTSELSKSISRMLSEINPLLDSNIAQRIISPPAIDYLIAGYGGTLGKDLWSLMDTMAQKWGVVDKVNKPEKSLEDLPLIGAFMVKYPNAGSRSVNDFFEKANRFEQTLATIQALMKEGTATSTQRAEYLLMNADYGRMTNIRGAIADISRMIRTIHFAPSPETDPDAGISPEDKRAQIDSLYLDMITMARGGLEIMQEIERTNKALRKEQPDANN